MPNQLIRRFVTVFLCVNLTLVGAASAQPSDGGPPGGLPVPDFVNGILDSIGGFLGGISDFVGGIFDAVLPEAAGGDDIPAYGS